MPTWTWAGKPVAISGRDDAEQLRQANLRADREKAKAAYWQEVATTRGDGPNAERVADEIMARIERDGAIHRDALVEVVQIYGRRAELAGHTQTTATQVATIKTVPAHPQSFGEARYKAEGGWIRDSQPREHIHCVLAQGLGYAKDSGLSGHVRHNGRLFEVRPGDFSVAEILERHQRTQK